MIEDVLDAVQVADIVAIAPVMDDRADLLVSLNPPQLPRDAVRQQMRPAEAPLHLRRRLESERRERLGEGGEVEYRLRLEAVKRHREPRRGVGQPAEAAMDVRAGAAQGAVFELQIDRIELPDRPADLLHLTIGQFLHARVRVAHQVLVQVEDRDIEDVVELTPHRGGVRGNAAKFAAGRDDRQRFLARRRTGDRGGPAGAMRDSGAECECRHS